MQCLFYTLLLIGLSFVHSGFAGSALYAETQSFIKRTNDPIDVSISAIVPHDTELDSAYVAIRRVLGDDSMKVQVEFQTYSDTLTTERDLTVIPNVQYLVYSATAAWRIASLKGAMGTDPIGHAIESASNGKLYTQEPKRPGEVDLFIMSQCPFGIEALLPMLDWAELNDRTLNVRFIVSKSGDTFTSLHGQKELEENLVLRHVLKTNPHVARSFVLLRKRKGYEGDPVVDAESVGVTGFEDAREALTLVRKSDYETTSRLSINSSPTVMVDGCRVMSYGTFAKSNDLTIVASTSSCNGS